MTGSPSQPPTRWRWLLGRALPERDRAGLLQEMDEMYARRVERDGLRAGRRWYREEVMAFVVRVPERRMRGVRRHWGGRAMDWIKQMGLVFRGLRRAPGFSGLALLTLTLGIGASTLIFTIADHAMLRPLPFPEADRLIVVLEGWTSSPGSVEILQRELSTVETLGAAWDAVGTSYEPEGQPAQRVSVAHVTPEYLLALGMAPRLGRLFLPEESEPGRGNVALVGSGFAERLGVGREILGTHIALDGDRHEVVGVLPEGFDMPSARNDIWIPTTMDGSEENVGLHWGMGVYTMLARMPDGVTPQQVREDVLRAQESVRLANPLWTPAPGFWDEGRVTPLQEARGRHARLPLLLLLSGAGLVLLVVCANVSNLLLSRGLSRKRDHAVRAALGAGLRRLAAHQMGEVMVLALAGSVGGLLLAVAGLDLIRPLLPPELPGLEQLALDTRVVAFTVILALLAGLASGILPALRMANQSPGDLLREEDRSRTGNRSKRRTTRVLVAGQIAIAVFLVTGAGLLTRSLHQLTLVDPGFSATDRVSARIDLPAGLAEDREARATYLERARESLEAGPVLSRVALSSSVPFGTVREGLAVFIPGVTDDPNNLPVVKQRRVSPNFFEVLGIPLLSGRSFNPSDRVGSLDVAIVDQPFADQFFPGEDPVGRMVRYPWRGATDIQVVGVVGATSDEQLSDMPGPTVYFPMSQMGSGPLSYAQVIALSSGSSAPALAELQRLVRDLDNRIAISELAPYPDLLGTSLATPRLLTLLLVLFAGTTLILGCIGVYGVSALSVRQRFREIGIRITLGARPQEIRRRVLRDGMLLALPGGLIGLILAAAGSRLLRSFLFGISGLDPVTFLAVPLVFAAAATLAVYWPARRATGVDPATVLREE